MHRFDPPVTSHCPNCGALDAAPFCGQCGQARPQRINAGLMWRQWVEQIETLDFAMVRTLRGLLGAPGATLRGYLGGRRQPYATPGKFFFILTTLIVAVTLMLPLPILPTASADAVPPQLGEWIVELQGFIFASRAYLQPLILLPLAWLVARLWRASRIGFAEAYVVLMYAFALVSLLQLLLATLAALWHPPLIAAARLLGTALVLVWLLHDLFADHLHRDAARALLVFIAYVPMSIAVMLPAYALLRLLGVDLIGH